MNHSNPSQSHNVIRLMRKQKRYIPGAITSSDLGQDIYATLVTGYKRKAIGIASILLSLLYLTPILFIFSLFNVLTLNVSVPVLLGSLFISAFVVLLTTQNWAYHITQIGNALWRFTPAGQLNRHEREKIKTISDKIERFTQLYDLVAYQQLARNHSYQTGVLLKHVSEESKDDFKNLLQKPSGTLFVYELLMRISEQENRELH